VTTRSEQRGLTRRGKLDLGDLEGPLAIASGGTGSTTASAARTALGLGSIATQAASAVAITGGTLTGTTVDNGAIGGSTPAAGTFTTLTATGQIVISGAAAGQIVFPATQNVSTNANTLDDYEEGTWTATLAGSGTAGTQTYGTQIGRYIKIGKCVLFNASIVLSAKDAATAGNMRIAGLPFTSVTVSGARWPCAIDNADLWDLNVGAGRYSMAASVGSNTTVITLTEQGDNVASAALTEADFAATSAIAVSGHYEAAS